MNNMISKPRIITGWVLSGLLAALYLFSAYNKLSGSEESIKGAVAMGLTASQLKLIGVIELLSITLFLIPRTGLLGTLLLAAYMGGAIATHLEHRLPVLAPCIIQAMVWITAVIRFPELSQRLTDTLPQLQKTNTK
jgi:hypothetical protein